MSFENLLAEYDYKFPKSLVALSPTTPRDKAKLLVFDRNNGEVTESAFIHLPDFVPDDTVLVFNQTKVLPARFLSHKSSGGKVELLYVGASPSGICVLSKKRLKVGECLRLEDGNKIEILERVGAEYIVRTEIDQNAFLLFLEKHGHIPLPPYLKDSTLTEDQRKQEYQTVFGKVAGAVAAPTASLHFTERLMNKLRDKGVEIHFVTLHVGLGTFASLTSENLQTHKLHTEYYEIDESTAKALNLVKKTGKKILAVGTTVVRTLESAEKNGQLVQLSGETDIFIEENTPLRFVDQLITNFHVPKSSLLMLVSAFIGRKKLFELYDFAIKKKYRLFSFGDGMYIK